MAGNWLRIDWVTFLTSLLAGLLPVAVLSVISYLSLETLREPLRDIVLREHVDYLQSRTERLDLEFRERLSRLERELAGCIAGDPPAADDIGDRDLVRALRWHVQYDPGLSLVLPAGEQHAEAILGSLSREHDPTRRQQRLETLTALPPSVQDPLGFSYGTEATLYLESRRSDLATLVLEHGSRLDPATLRALLERLDGHLEHPSLPVSMSIVQTRPHLHPGESRGVAGTPETLELGIAVATGGTLVCEIDGRTLIHRALAAVVARDTPREGLHLVLRERVTEPDAGGEGAAPERVELTQRLAPPMTARWELILKNDHEAPQALELLGRMQGIHYVGWGVAVILVTAVATILLGMVASRRVRTSQQKDDFLRLVSHELRTPIAAVKILAETLSLGRVHDEQDRQDMIAQLGAEADRLSELVERVLEYGRTQGGRARVREVITDPGELVEEAVALFRERQPDAGEIVVRTAQEFHPVVLDRDAVMRVVLNLLSNARKFSGPENAIEVLVGEESRSLFVEVRDQGSGIRKRDQRRVFRAFYRGRHSRGPAGFGLGLAYCKEVAEAHRGKIRVRSAPGEGSAFTLEIPLVHPKEGGP